MVTQKPFFVCVNVECFFLLLGYIFHGLLVLLVKTEVIISTLSCFKVGTMSIGLVLEHIVQDHDNVDDID